MRQTSRLLLIALLCWASSLTHAEASCAVPSTSVCCATSPPTPSPLPVQRMLQGSPCLTWQQGKQIGLTVLAPGASCGLFSKIIISPVTWPKLRPHLPYQSMLSSIVVSEAKGQPFKSKELDQIIAALPSPRRVTSLTVESTLDEIPGSMRQLSGLQKITLTRWTGSAFPHFSYSRLPLEELSVNSHYATGIPSELMTIPTLQTLYFQSKETVSYPAWMDKLPMRLSETVITESVGIPRSLCFPSKQNGRMPCYAGTYEQSVCQRLQDRRYPEPPVTDLNTTIHSITPR